MLKPQSGEKTMEPTPHEDFKITEVTTMMVTAESRHFPSAERGWHGLESSGTNTQPRNFPKQRENAFRLHPNPKSPLKRSENMFPAAAANSWPYVYYTCPQRFLRQNTWDFVVRNKIAPVKGLQTKKRSKPEQLREAIVQL